MSRWNTLCLAGCLAAVVVGGPSRAVAEVSVLDLIQLDVSELQDIVVTTASKAPQGQAQAPATVRVISAEQIRARGYHDLEDALADLPGFQFRNIQGFNSYSFLRGAPSQNNLILLLVDGVQVNELNSGGFYGGGQFNLDNVERIEVVYGPASALYGTNAMSGVINLITYDPSAAAARGGGVSATAGGFATRAGHVRVAGYDAPRRFGYSLAGMLKTGDKADLRGAAGDYNWSEALDTEEQDRELDGKLQYRDFTLGLLYQDKQASRATNYKSLDTEKLDYGTLWHIRFVNLWGKYSRALREDLDLNALAYYRDTTLMDDSVAYIDRAAPGTPGRQVGYYRPGSLSGLDGQLTYRATPRLQITGGLNWEGENLSQDFAQSGSAAQDLLPPPPPEPARASNRALSLYAEGQYRLGGDWESTLGLRHADSSVYGRVTTPRLGLVYNRAGLTWKLLYAEAFRAPKPWDYHYGAGNPALHPENMRAVETYLGYRPHAGLNLGLSLYRNAVTDKLVLDGVDGRWVNLGELRSRGLEASGEFAWDRLRAFVNYSYTEAEDEHGAALPEIARHGWNLGLEYAAGPRLALYLRGNYLGRRDNPQLIPATGDTLIDAAWVAYAGAAYRTGDWEFALDARNLLDTEYYHPSNRPPSRYRQPQRALLCTLRYHF